ncbi:conidiation-specific protein 6 [Rhypophila decipiens]
MPTDAQIAGGHKANLKNPKTSEESKENSKKILENEFNVQVDGDNGEHKTSRLTVEIIERHADDVVKNRLQPPNPMMTMGRTPRMLPVVLRRKLISTPFGLIPTNKFIKFDSTLKNPNVSDEAKESAKERLDNECKLKDVGI